MEALLASLGTLLVVAGYMIVKRMARSKCDIKSGCLHCKSPAVELQKQHTQRLDEIFEMLKQVHPEQEIIKQLDPDPPISLTPDHFAIDDLATTEVKTFGNNLSSC